MTDRSLGERAREALEDASRRADGARCLTLVARLLEVTGPAGTHELLTPRPQVERTDGRRQITSMYAGKCSRCRAPISAGDGIWIAEGKPGAICSFCARGTR